MKKIMMVSFFSMLPSFAFAAPATDLVLPSAKWVASFNKYVCDTSGASVEAPEALSQLKVAFDQLSTDSTLDNARVTANFEENGKACRYNAILVADNATRTSTLVQSIAYESGSTDASAYRACSAGKKILDQAFSATEYLYYGHPHSVAFMLRGVGGEAVCGEGSQAVGVNFLLKGKITQ